MQDSGWKPADLKHHLEQPSQLKAIKERYGIIIAEEVELQPCVLRCKGCSKLVSLTQPHQSTKQHNDTCKSPPAADEEMELLDEGNDEEERGGKRKRKRTQKNALTRYMPSAKVQEGVQKDLLRSVITGEVPFRFLNNKFLKGASVGVHIKKRVYL